MWINGDAEGSINVFILVKHQIWRATQGPCFVVLTMKQEVKQLLNIKREIIKAETEKSKVTRS